MDNKINISVIIPVYNEQTTCDKIINKVKKIDLVKEIIVVDDASTDTTFEILNKIGDIKKGLPGQIVAKDKMDILMPGYAWDLLPKKKIH